MARKAIADATDAGIPFFRTAVTGFAVDCETDEAAGH
jgi:hypothetical protein